jgi:DTW domain-containing protein YfiP
MNQAPTRPTFRLRGRHQYLQRCPRCALHVPLCVCDLITPLNTKSRVTLIIHVKEWVRTSNTGRLLDLCLNNAEIRLRGQKGHPTPQDGLRPVEYRNVVLYPSPHSIPLTEEWIQGDPRPIHFLVPDGNWGQASRMVKREAVLSELPHVRLPTGPPSKFRIRSHPDVDRVSTFESVARALGLSESREAQDTLENIFDISVERTLWSRGQLRAEDVCGGIPESAF